MSTTFKSNNDNTLATGRSEPDKAKLVPFEDRKDAGPNNSEKSKSDEPRDAGDIAEKKQGSGERTKRRSGLFRLRS
ncbi:hypothetical protein [Chenggangzhangella methanolivorans]|uniref:Uncharacterized protein n=1 Tax=Chenggangzhangella methanolivorans TaxID=1437009 RepID=A0A9E6RD52_9HYPH|nr:hypothetical protein [Chenggangzhangella methanolivorans]QZO01093.1 hypothetical protein K6K41_05825 [Chenggangzhangella methanolivorans]